MKKNKIKLEIFERNPFKKICCCGPGDILCSPEEVVALLKTHLQNETTS